jgi:hypothetical protein
MLSKPLNIVYVSGLTIEDPSLLATLAVVYDKVYLPHAYDLDPDARPLMRWPMKHMDDLELIQRGYKTWKDHWKALFESGVIEVLPPALHPEVGDPADLQARLLQELHISVPFFASSDVFSGRVALAVHAIFARTTDPEFLLSRPGVTDTSHLRDTLATSLIQYRIPKIGEMSPERLLRIRAETRVDREGFIYYLNQLVDNVESRLAAAAGDERVAALRTVERVILPELEEHLRQEKLRAEKTLARMLRLVATGVSTVVGVVLAPWDFKNYTGASELLLEGADARIETRLQQAANKHRAFQFMASIEGAHG